MSPLSLSPAYRIGMMLILLAAIGLCSMAWRGLVKQRDMVWSEAQIEASEVAKEFLAELNQRSRTIQKYEFPPTPGTTPFDRSASLPELREQMALNERTLTGLPVSVLAAFEVAKRSGNVRDGETARNLALKRWPDLTTPLVLQNLARLAEEQQWEGDFSNWETTWQADEKARDLARSVREPGWLWHEGQLSRIEFIDEQQFSFLTLPEQLDNDPGKGRFGIALHHEGKIWGRSGKELFHQELGFTALAIGVLDPLAIEAPWREQRKNTIALLSFAILIIAIGIFIITRGLLREKKISHAKGQFVASVTHELRAPVGAMRLMADGLNSGKLAPEKTAVFNRLLSRESSRLSVLIENVMDLARLEDGQRAIKLEELEFEEIITEVCEMMAMQAEESKMTLIKIGDPLRVKADPVILRQILVNLIDNALKFSPPGGTVTISWGPGWWFSIADQGPGIPPEHLPHIFDRFYRGENELRRKTKGVGIGLSLVKELAALHRGTVSVTNQNGALFKVTFPNS